MAVARDLDGKKIVITGANTGIGRATAATLARRGARVVLACRSEAKTRPALDEIRANGGQAEFLALELGDLGSVERAAEALLAQGEPLPVLLNNAGVAGQRGFTASGFELHFGTNHVGHFAFTLRLWPLLRAAGQARVVNVSSRSHYQARGIDFDEVRRSTRSVTGLPEYAVSKLANVLFTRELARRAAGQGVHSYALHPGVVASDAWRRMPWPVRPLIKLFMITNDEGSAASLHCATSPEVAEHDGRFYDWTCKERRPSRPALDDALAAELWRRSVEWTGVDLPASP